MKIILSSIAAFATLSASCPLLATSTEATTVMIRTDDLRLETADGQKILERRIADAARQVCGINEQRTGSRMRSNASVKCYQTTRAKIAQQYAVLLKDKQLGG